MQPTEKRSRFSTSGARVPVSLVAFFFLCYLLIDSVAHQWWETAAIWSALIAAVLYWLLAPEIRKRR